MLRLTLILVGLACGAWLGGRRRRLEPPADNPIPPISVVIPARDEEHNLPLLLRALAAQEAPPHEILVVDDGSTDRTAAVAAAAGAAVLTAPPRPDGWLGKPWACHIGAEAATGTHLLFVDADVTLAPDALARLAATHATNGEPAPGSGVGTTRSAAGSGGDPANLHPDRVRGHPDQLQVRGGLLSVQPHHRTQRPYEELSLFPNVVALLGTGAAAVGGRPGMRGAFGPCLLTSKADYLTAGGHAAVHDQVVEDLALGEAYRAAGLPVHGRLGGGAIAYRMYPGGLGQLVEGWTKNLATGATRVGVAAIGAAAWVTACVAVVVGLVVDPSPVAAAVHLLAAVELAWLARRVGAFRWWSAALLPIPLAFFVAVFLRSAVLTALRRPVAWHGRRVPVG